MSKQMSSLRIGMSPGFLDSLSRLPRRIQKKTRDFLEKLQLDPSRRGLNIEPIHEAAGSNVRSARIDRNYRAIVVDQSEHGLLVLVFVANHDEAYRWVRNRTFRLSLENLTLFVRLNPPNPTEQDAGSSTRAAREPDIVSAKQQTESKRRVAETCALSEYSDETLLLLGVPPALLTAVRQVQSEKMLDDLEPFLPEDLHSRLAALQLGYSPEEAKTQVPDRVKLLSDALQDETLARVPRRLHYTRFVYFLLIIVMTVVSLLAWQALSAPTHWLWIDALYDAGDAYLDDDPIPHKTPTDAIAITPGSHRIRYTAESSQDIAREFVVPEERHFTRVTLFEINRGTTPIESPELYAGPDAAYLQAFGGAHENSLLIDGAKRPAVGRWIRMKPGRHVLEARSPLGRTERQEIELRPNEMHVTHLLWRETAKIPGEFRFTLANVFAPLPEFARLECGDGAVRFMNSFPEVAGEPDQLAVDTMIKPAIEDKEVSATLSITFPKRMRSISFMHLGKSSPPNSIVIEYRTENEPWRISEVDHAIGGVPEPEKPPMGVHQAQLNESGTMRFELRGRMKMVREPTGWSPVKFLSAYMDRYRGDEICCFAIVADSGPEVARVR